MKSGKEIGRGAKSHHCNDKIMTLVDRETDPISSSILTPEEVCKRMTPLEVAQHFSNLLDIVYSGRSDVPGAHSHAKFEKMLKEGTMFPFLVMSNQKPLGCCAWRWDGPVFDFGNACILKEYQGGKATTSGKDLYKVADDWLKKNMENRFVLTIGGFRIPESVVVAIKHRGWFPCWIAPLASWGYPNESLLDSGREQEFLVLGEKYEKDRIIVPDIVYLPQSHRVKAEIVNIWYALSEYKGANKDPGFEIAKTRLVSGPTVLKATKGEEESIEFSCDFDNPDGYEVSQAFEKAVSGKVAGHPKTRLVFINVPVEHPNASFLQDTLLEEGFIFSGIIPGISTTNYQDIGRTTKTYRRKSMNVFSKLRPDILRQLTRPKEKILFENTRYTNFFANVIESWFTQK